MSRASSSVFAVLGPARSALSPRSFGLGSARPRFQYVRATLAALLTVVGAACGGGADPAVEARDAGGVVQKDAATSPDHDAASRDASISPVVDAGHDAHVTSGPETPLYLEPFSVPSRESFTAPEFPLTSDGTGYLLMEHREASLVFQPSLSDPIVYAAECAGLVAACFEPGIRNASGCLENLPSCPEELPAAAEERPFCCPEACAARYQEVLSETPTADVATAVTDAIFGPSSCIPGLDAFLAQ